MTDAPAPRYGKAASTVLITPTRSTETASRKATGVSSLPVFDVLGLLLVIVLLSHSGQPTG